MSVASQGLKIFKLTRSGNRFTESLEAFGAASFLSPAEQLPQTGTTTLLGTGTRHKTHSTFHYTYYVYSFIQINIAT